MIDTNKVTISPKAIALVMGSQINRLEVVDWSVF